MYSGMVVSSISMPTFKSAASVPRRPCPTRSGPRRPTGLPQRRRARRDPATDTAAAGIPVLGVAPQRAPPGQRHLRELVSVTPGFDSCWRAAETHTSRSDGTCRRSGTPRRTRRWRTTRQRRVEWKLTRGQRTDCRHETETCSSFAPARRIRSRRHDGWVQRMGQSTAVGQQFRKFLGY